MASVYKSRSRFCKSLEIPITIDSDNPRQHQRHHRRTYNRKRFRVFADLEAVVHNTFMIEVIVDAVGASSFAKYAEISLSDDDRL